MTFTEAIVLVQSGGRVRRPGWRSDVSIRAPHPGTSRFVEVGGERGSPSRWTPWLADLFATDWQEWGA